MSHLDVLAAAATHEPCDEQHAAVVGECERLQDELRAAVEERDELRAAAQAVMDCADTWADEKDHPLWDDIPTELWPFLDALRAAIHREDGTYEPTDAERLAYLTYDAQHPETRRRG